MTTSPASFGSCCSRPPAPGRSDSAPPGLQRALTTQTGTLEPAHGLFWHPVPDSPLRRHLGSLRLHWHRHVDLTQQGRWAVLLTNKLYCTHDRQPSDTHPQRLPRTRLQLTQMLRQTGALSSAFTRLPLAPSCPGVCQTQPHGQCVWVRSPCVRTTVGVDVVTKGHRSSRQ